MSTRSRKDKQKNKDSASSTVTATLTPMLADHKTALHTVFNAAFSKLETKLNNIQATLLDHQQRLSSLEAAATTTSQDMRAMQMKLTMITEENTTLRAKLINLESRSCRHNIRIVGTLMVPSLQRSSSSSYSRSLGNTL